MNSKLPAVELMDKIALESLVLEEEEFAIRVLRSRYRAYPNVPDDRLMYDLEGFTGENGERIRRAVIDAKNEPFDILNSYKLEIPSRCISSASG
jgi:hypothetical protein